MSIKSRWTLIAFALAGCQSPEVPAEQQAALADPPSASCPQQLGIVSCDGECRDTSRDRLACGSCTTACAPGHQCVEGLCRADSLPRTPTRKPDPGTWTQRSPKYGGRISGVVARSGEANSLAITSPGGGAWFTSNNGASWSQPYVSGGVVSYLGDFSDVHLEWDRATTGRLFLQTRSDLYATTNFGSTWTNLTGRGGVPAPLMPNNGVAGATDARPFTQMVVSGGTRIVLAALPCNGLLYSYDGSTFTQTFPFPGGETNPDNCIQSIAGDDPSGFVYFATQADPGTGAAHVYASTCAWTSTSPCLSWALANGSLPSGLWVESLVDTANYGGGPTFPNNLAALLPSNRGSSASQVYLTSNGGSTWSAAAAFPSTSWSYATIDYPGQNQLFAGTVFPYQSPNTYGASWLSMSGSSDHSDVRAFYWDNALGFLWAGNDGGNSDGSAWNLTRWSWTIGATPASETRVPTTGTSGLPIWQAYAMAVTPASTASGRRAFIGLQDNGASCSDDGGVTWTTSGSPPAGGDVASVVFAPSNLAVAYSRGDTSNPVRTSNANASSCGAVTWSTCAVSASPPAFWTNHMTAVHPTNPNKVYFAQQAGGGSVLISSDGCTTGSSSAALAQVISLYVDASGNIYAGTLGHGAYVSTNDGASWTPWALNSSPPVVVLAIAWSPAGGGTGTFYLATTNGLYQLLPGGSWTLVAGGGGYTVSDVAVDPHCSQHVFAAFGYVGAIGSHRGGILYSNNNGSTWTSITAGLTLHQGPIANVQVDPISSEFLWAASFGLGGWYYDSGSATCP